MAVRKEKHMITDKQVTNLVSRKLPYKSRKENNHVRQLHSRIKTEYKKAVRL